MVLMSEYESNYFNKTDTSNLYYNFDEKTDFLIYLLIIYYYYNVMNYDFKIVIKSTMQTAVLHIVGNLHNK